MSPPPLLFRAPWRANVKNTTEKRGRFGGIRVFPFVWVESFSVRETAFEDRRPMMRLAFSDLASLSRLRWTRDTSLSGKRRRAPFSSFSPSLLPSAANNCRHAFFCSLYNADLPNVFYFVSPLLSCLPCCRFTCARFPAARISRSYMRARLKMINITSHDRKA